jgi:hypothetical protein
LRQGTLRDEDDQRAGERKTTNGPACALLSVQTHRSELERSGVITAPLLFVFPLVVLVEEPWGRQDRERQQEDPAKCAVEFADKHEC